MLGPMTQPTPSRPVVSLVAVSLALAATLGPAAEVPARVPPEREWRAHGGDPGHTQHSPLAQITPANVARLRVAWTYHTGDARADDRSQIQCNPVVVDGVLYATSAGLKAFALDAATGRELWRFDPFAAGAEESALGVNRGVVVWGDGAERRVLYSAGQYLFALDARTGKLVPGFGKGGRVDLREGLGRDPAGLFVLSTTPGAVYRDLLILGTRVHEGPGPSAPGHVRAYDARTGAIRWTFHTIPRPGEPGYETWPPDAWKTVGGANAWSGISVDHARGLVFLPTGSPAWDFWGGDRHGANLFGNCVLALKAATGERVWHYQVVRHDLWDRDLPQAPVLVTVKRDGREVDAVAQATKSGHVFVFDRETGEPLFPIEERTVPASDLKGERAWPTQPVPVKPPPFARQSFTEEDATDISPASRAAVLERLRRVRSGGQFVPPSTQGTMIFPGFDGGAEWGGSAFDPETRLLYVNANEMPWILEMLELPPPGEGGPLGARVYAQHCTVCHGIDRQGRPAGTVPAAHRARGPEEEAGRRHAPREGQGGHAGVRVPPAGRDRGRRLARPGRAGARPREGRGGAVGAPVHAPRLQPVPRPRGLPGGEAALGHAQRHRPRRGRDPVVGPARRDARSSRSAASRRPAPRTTAGRSSPRAGSSSSARRRTSASARSTRGPGSGSGRRRCPPAATRRRRRTRRTAGSTS